jgi:iron(III) transport system permease protein
MTGALFVFILTLSEFGAPALMQVNVYPVAVYIAFSAFYDFARAAVLCLPFVAVAATLGGLMHAVTHNTDFTSLSEHGRARCIALGRGRFVVSILSFVVLGVAFGAPIGALIGKAGADAVWDNVREPLLWSLGLSFIGATMLTFFGLLMAWLCQRDYAPGGAWWLHGQLVLFALPSTIVGLGLVGLWNRPIFGWFYGTAGMIAVGFFARFIPLIIAAFGAFLRQIPKDGEEAIWLDGGGVWTTFTRFILPVSRRTLTRFWIFSFILCMGELSTTILVSPPGIQTLAVYLFTIEANAPQARTANLALALIAACLAPLLIGGILFRKESSR